VFNLYNNACDGGMNLLSTATSTKTSAAASTTTS